MQTRDDLLRNRMHARSVAVVTPTILLGVQPKTSDTIRMYTKLEETYETPIMNAIMTIIRIIIIKCLFFLWKCFLMNALGFWYRML